MKLDGVFGLVVIRRSAHLLALSRQSGILPCLGSRSRPRRSGAAGWDATAWTAGPGPPRPSPLYRAVNFCKHGHDAPYSRARPL